MTHAWLRSLNAPLLLLLVAWSMAVLSTVFSASILELLKPNLLILLALYVALRRGFLEGGLLSLAFGYLEELHSSLPRGGGLAMGMGVFLAIHALRRYFLIPTLRPPLWVFPLSTILGKGILLGVLHAHGLAHAQWQQTLLWLGPSALVDAVHALWIFRAIGRLDWHTFKDERATRVQDGELVLDEEGI